MFWFDKLHPEIQNKLCFFVTLKTEHKTLPKDQSQVKNYEETCNTYGPIRPMVETLILMLLDLNALSAGEGPQGFNSTLSHSLKVPMQTKGALPFDFFIH